MTAFGLPARVAYVVAEDVDSSRVFLMHLPNGSPVALNGTAALIWALATEGDQDVVGAVCEAVDRTRVDIEQDVLAHLQNLVEAGFLTVRTD